MRSSPAEGGTGRSGQWTGRRTAGWTGGARGTLLAAAAIATAWLGLSRSFTWQAYGGVAAVMLAVLWVARVAPPPRHPAPRRLPVAGILAWSVPILAFSTLEIVDNALGSTDAHPTLSSMLDRTMTEPVPKTVAVAVWLAAGWALLRR